MSNDTLLDNFVRCFTADCCGDPLEDDLVVPHLTDELALEPIYPFACFRKPFYGRNWKSVYNNLALR